MADEVENLKQPQSKNPMETATNKLRESMSKEAQKKIDEQLKKTLDAAKIFKNEKSSLQQMLTDFEGEKIALKELLGDLS